MIPNREEPIMSTEHRPTSNPSTQPPPSEPSSRMVPNVSLSRAARVGARTEDELLLERPKHPQPVPRNPAQAEFKQGDPWRVLRIMGEYVHAFDALAEVGA